MYLVYYGIRDLYIGIILNEKRSCQLCSCVLVHSNDIIFSQVSLRSESSTVILVVPVYSHIIGRAV